MGDRGRIVSVGGGADTVEKGVTQIAEQGVALSEIPDCGRRLPR